MSRFRYVIFPFRQKCSSELATKEKISGSVNKPNISQSKKESNISAIKVKGNRFRRYSLLTDICSLICFGNIPELFCTRDWVYIPPSLCAGPINGYQKHLAAVNAAQEGMKAKVRTLLQLTDIQY